MNFRLWQKINLWQKAEEPPSKPVSCAFTKADREVVVITAIAFGMAIIVQLLIIF